MKEEQMKEEKNHLEGENGFEAHDIEKAIQGEAQGEPSQKKKWIVLSVFLGVAVILAAVYFAGYFYYRDRFFPNTSINGMACGKLEAAAVAPMIDEQVQEYTLKVTGRDYETGESGALLGTIHATDIGLTYAGTKQAVQELLDMQNPFAWFVPYFKKAEQSHSLVQGVSFDKNRLEEVVGGWAACSEENMRPPENAYISEYMEEKNGYEILAETEGTSLEMNRVLEHIGTAIYANQQELDLEEAECYTEAAVKSTDSKLNEVKDTVNKWLSAEITYDWNCNEVVLDKEKLQEWITVEAGEAVLDEEAVGSFVRKQARLYDTYAKDKKFVTALGYELVLNSASYGWKTDTEAETQELIQLIQQGSQTKKEPVYIRKGVLRGADDIGNSYVEADLTNQHLYVFQDGNIVFETDFVSGRMNADPGCVSPQGIFGLSYKTTNAVLRGSDYATPVSYWMPFFGNYGMHDATWRKDFGGIIYQNYGSHGCLNLPLDAAAVIYDYVYTGSPIICYYYPPEIMVSTATLEGFTEEELLQQQEATLSGSVE